MGEEPVLVLCATELPLPLFTRGKSRDIYDLGDRLLVIASDRVSAFDVVLPDGIPWKGFVLNQLSAFWFHHTGGMIPNHLVAVIDDVKRLDDFLPPSQRFPYPSYLSGRCMVVKKVKRIPLECVVRGYLAGSGWEDYRRYGAVSGVKLPAGLRESQELETPIFTPTSKADAGHDLPLTMDEVIKQVGSSLAEELGSVTLALYASARQYARSRGLLIADTKMEFGLDSGKLILIDELLTPDSSRFWDMDLYRVGEPQPSYDKQPLRDWLARTDWNKEPPAPRLPPDIVQDTSERYIRAYERLTGRKLAR